MYAAHFAAGLAIKSRVPKAPAWALLGGAFLPDFFWIALAQRGIEPSDTAHFFDGWSHSLLSILVQASAFAACFYRQGRTVVIAIWLAVFSHFLLDLPVHPRPLQLYPHSAIALGWNDWDWGQRLSWLGESHYWWLQLGCVLVLLTVYLVSAPKARIPWNLAAASVLLVLSLHIAPFF